MALSEANRALVQQANNLTARMAKAESLYTLYMFRMALSEANRALVQQANNLTARMAKAEALYSTPSTCSGWPCLRQTVPWGSRLAT